MKTEEELLHEMTEGVSLCPFCGEQALLTEHPPHTHCFVDMPDHPGSWDISCPKCGCGMIDGSKEIVLSRWNARAPVQAEPVNTRLLDALKNVLPWVVTQEVACNGLKCREAVCMSCDSDSEANAEKAAQAYAVANQAIAAAEAQEPDCDGSYDNWPEDRINVIGQNGNTGEHYPEHHSKQAQTYACGIQAGSG